MELNEDKFFYIRSGETTMLFHNIDLDRWEVWNVVREIDYSNDISEDGEHQMSEFTYFGHWIIEFEAVFPQTEREQVLQECDDLLSRRKVVPEPYFKTDCDYYVRLKEFERKTGKLLRGS